MKRILFTLLLVPAMIGSGLVNALPAAAAGTTYAAETGNNTSTCVLGSASAPSDCVANFTGQTDTRTGIETPLFDPPGGNVSPNSAKYVLYSGNTTKIFVNMMLGFCTPADGTSSGGVSRCNSNVLTQYTSNDTATVDAQLADMARRDIDGMVMTWYGNGSGSNAATLKFQSEIKNKGYCPGGPQKCQIMYLNMYDGSTLKYAVTPTGIPGTSGSGCATSLGATDAENCVIARIRNDLCYMNGYHFGNDAYQKWNGRPQVQWFIDESMYPNLPRTGAAPSWTDVWYWVRQWSNSLTTNCAKAPYNANNGSPLFIFRNSGGFTHAQSDGAFGWINPLQNQDDLRIGPESNGGTVQNFYRAALNNPTKLVWGEAYKGFNDIQSAWGEHRIVDQRCGKTWLDSLSAANSYYSSANQLPFLQVATWNDYNEGTSLETGIDNCYRVSASISGTTLNWAANTTSSYAWQGTISTWRVFDSTDGTNYTQIASLTPSYRSYDLSGLAPGTHHIFVKMVGRAGILSRSSAQLTFTR